jgi:predicted nuclease of restriction endonuclease-like RecB superfamily
LRPQPLPFARREPSGRPLDLTQLDALARTRMIVPAYLTEADFPWLRALLEEYARFVGRKRGEWKIRSSEALPIEAPRTKLQTALRVLERLAQAQPASAVPARQVRALLFREGARRPERDSAIQATANALGIAPQAVMDALFADLPDERLMLPLSEPISPAQLALRCNQELVASLLGRALRVRLAARGQVRAVVRHAKLMGLLCHATPGEDKEHVTLEISGPFALFRHTRIYARALASLLPRLAWCHAYRLEAECVLGDSTQVGRLVLATGDPIAPARELGAYDSKTEQRFAKAFGKLAPEWDLVREPQAVALGTSLIFPDFELRHRATGRSWLLEIVGYWTPEYVQRKLSALREAKLERLIVCLDVERCCSDDALPADARVLRFRRKVDPRAVLALIEQG